MNESAETDVGGTLQTRQFALVAACFLISGFAALLYETVWLRQFAILLGTSEQALAVVFYLCEDHLLKIRNVIGGPSRSANRAANLCFR